MKRAAARASSRILQSFDHPGILDALDYKDHEYGPALLFAYEPLAMRLDHYLATRGRSSRPARGWSCSARSPTPSATPTPSGSSTGRLAARERILVMDPDAPVPRLKVFNWQGRRPRGRGRLQPPRSTSGSWSIARRPSTWHLRRCRTRRGGARGVRTSSLLGAWLALTTSSAGRPPGESPAEVAARTLGRHSRPEGLGGARRARGAEAGGAGSAPEHRTPTSTSASPPRPDFLKLSSTPSGTSWTPTLGHARGRWTPAEARQGATAWRGASSVERARPGGDRRASRCWSRQGEDEFVIRGRPRGLRTTQTGSRGGGGDQEGLRSEFIVGPCTRSARSAGGRSWCIDNVVARDAGRAAPQARGGWAWSCSSGSARILLQGGRLAGAEWGRAPRHPSPTTSASARASSGSNSILFDFSLSCAPPAEQGPGRHPPALPRPLPVPAGAAARWDQAAGRYPARRGGGGGGGAGRPAAVRAISGKSDPAARPTTRLTRSRPSGSTRRSATALAAFFRRAADRDPAASGFDNAEEMLRAWRGRPPGRAGDSATPGGDAEVAAPDRALDQRGPRDAGGHSGPEHPGRQRPGSGRGGRRPPVPRPAGLRGPVHAGRGQEDKGRADLGPRPAPEAVPRGRRTGAARVPPNGRRPRTRRRLGPRRPCDAAARRDAPPAARAPPSARQDSVEPIFDWAISGDRPRSLARPAVRGLGRAGRDPTADQPGPEGRPGSVDMRTGGHLSPR